MQAKQYVKPLTEKRIETLNRTELLAISEKIVIDGSSLRQIYETHLVGERGLRRLVAEHLRGGDIKKALRQEIVEREIDFERDPILRDMAPHSAPAETGGGKAVLDQLLQNAHVPGMETSEEAAYYKARAAYDAHQQDHQQKQRQLMDVSMIGIILLLVALVSFLVITHS